MTWWVRLQVLGRMSEVLSGLPLLWTCRNLVYRLKVPGLSFPIPRSLSWAWKWLPRLWRVMTPVVRSGARLVIRESSVVEVAPRLMLMVPIVLLMMVLRVLVSCPRLMLRRHRFMLTVPGLTPMSLERGLRRWCVTEIVLWSEMLRLGNLWVVSLEVEQIEVLVLSMTIPMGWVLRGSVPTVLLITPLALCDVALPLTVTSLTLRCWTRLRTAVRVLCTLTSGRNGQSAVAVRIPLAVLTVVVPILA